MSGKWFYGGEKVEKWRFGYEIWRKKEREWEEKRERWVMQLGAKMRPKSALKANKRLDGWDAFT